MFRDDSAIRTINREGVLLLGGGRALLMQLAHPSVAAGVEEHSGFQADRFARLLRTLRGSYAIVFGSDEQARQAAARINAAHQRVAGAGYRATDPDLLLWVHATLVDTSLLVHSLFLRPVPVDEGERYYRDSRRVAEALGIPREALPDDLAAFRRYVQAMVATLEVTDTARALAGDIFRSPAPGAAPLSLAARELTAALLPPRLRAQYRFPWDERRAAAFRVASAVSRALAPHLPPALRGVPAPLLPPTAGQRAVECRSPA